MALKDIFTMIKADRYTADGCEEIKKAQKAIAEDAGLPDGTMRHRKDGDYIKQAGKWVPAKKGNGGAKKPEEKRKFDQRKYGTSPAAKEDAIRASIVERMTPEQREAVMNGRTLRTVKEGQGVIDITKEDLEFFDKHNAERKPTESKPAAPSESGSGVPIKGDDWFSLPSGTRVTHEGAKEHMAQNNARIETLKKKMEGRSKADNFRLGAELKRLQNENEWIAERLPPEEKPSESKPAATPQNSIIGKLSGEEKNKIYKLFEDADFKKQLDNKLEFGLDDKVGEMILKKMPHGVLQSKIYDLSRDYNRENFKDARDYKSGLAEAAMGQLYKDYKEGKTSDSAPRVLTGDCKIRIRKSK